MAGREDGDMQNCKIGNEGGRAAGRTGEKAVRTVRRKDGDRQNWRTGSQEGDRQNQKKAAKM
jgi:hypothetical protein